MRATTNDINPRANSVKKENGGRRKNHLPPHFSFERLPALTGI